MFQTSEITRRLYRRLDQMSVVRDGMRRRVRGASMVAKMRWDVMEAELYDLEKGAERGVTEANHDALTASMLRVDAFGAWFDTTR